jgi:hypothetical protein
MPIFEETMEEKANFFAFFLYRQYELIVAACFDQIFGHLPGGQEFQQFFAPVSAL